MKYSEFSFIEAIKNQVIVPETFEGIGDDCAVIKISETIAQVITTDMLVEGVHFLKDKISPYQLGRKSVAVNLSDIAAMGANPQAIFLSISIPKETDNQWLDEFIRGVISWNIPLLGGDTTSSINGVVINITACGTIDYKNIKRRSKAKVGDAIYVTGNLGDSAGGLYCILNNIENDILIDAHNNPQPHINQGITLGRCESVNAMMDVSDGVAGDLKQILKASNVSAIVYTDNIPTSKALGNLCKYHLLNELELTLCGGEDYVLLFTASEKINLPFQIFPIGKIIPGTNNEIEYKPQNINLKGFTHF